MNLTVSKWGNSLGIRIPTSVINALSIKKGDSISYEIINNTLVLEKEKSTRELFEEFYGKSYDQITMDDIGGCEEIDWGEDVGGEIF